MIALLLSAGRHPVSLRPRMSPGCARAAEIALQSGRALRAFHVGDPGNPALRDYLGLGLGELSVLDPGGPADALPPLAAALGRLAPRVILCGAAAETGEGGGMLPYALAQALGLPVLAGVVAIEAETVVQAVSATLWRRYALDRPAVLVASASAGPVPRPVAFARARAGRIHVEPVAAPPDPLDALTEVRPARARPRRLRAAAPGGGGGPALTGLAPQEAARRLREFLQDNGLIGKDGHVGNL